MDIIPKPQRLNIENFYLRVLIQLMWEICKAIIKNHCDTLYNKVPQWFSSFIFERLSLELTLEHRHFDHDYVKSDPLT